MGDRPPPSHICLGRRRRLPKSCILSLKSPMPAAGIPRQNVYTLIIQTLSVLQGTQKNMLHMYLVQRPLLLGMLDVQANPSLSPHQSNYRRRRHLPETTVKIPNVGILHTRALQCSCFEFRSRNPNEKNTAKPNRNYRGRFR